MRLGLGDPVVARRILLWGVAAFAIFLNFPVFAWSMRVAGKAFTPVQGYATSALAVVAACCIWSAFFPPPKRLTRRPVDLPAQRPGPTG